MYSNSSAIPLYSARVLAAVRAASLSLAIAPHPHTSAHTLFRTAAVRHMATHRIVSYRRAAHQTTPIASASALRSASQASPSIISSEHVRSQRHTTGALN